MGRDWLQTNGVRIYYDLGAVRINNEYAPLEEDYLIGNVARMTFTTVLKPQASTVCEVKIKNKMKKGKAYVIEHQNSEFLRNFPGVSVTSAVISSDDHRKIPIVITNNTNQTLKVYRGSVIGNITSALEIAVVENDEGGGSKVDLENVKVACQFRAPITKLVRHNSDLFATTDKDLGRTSTVKMRIDTGNHSPIKKSPYRAPLKQREEISKAVDEMLQAKVIEKSRSPWSFPVVLVTKRDGSNRFCIDYRSLNNITKNNSFPLPMIDDLLATLGKAKYFSKLDQKSGYWQVELDEKDKEKTAFTCHKGLFHFNVLPFGLTKAPSVFQELVSVVLEGMDRYALAYLDDVLIFSKTKEDHLRDIENVFRQLREHNLKLKLSKCEFFMDEISYLGFTVNEKGIQPDSDKIKAISTLATPQSVRDVRSFIGMCSYYRRFIPKFSSIAEPLIELTRKYARFKWTEGCQLAFDSLKNSLIGASVLAYPDLNKPYNLYTDASNFAIGACLTQTHFDQDEGREVERPIYFLSHKLSDTQSRWSTIEKEAFAIFYALQKLDHYLHNSTFVIYCDHKPLEYLFKSPIQNKKIQLWALSISAYDCQIRHLAGRENVCADLLSRSTGASEDKAFKPLDLDDRTYEVGVIDSNEFEPREFASYHPEVAPPAVSTKPEWQNVDIVMAQDEDRDIYELRERLREGEATESEKNKYLILDETLYYLSHPDEEPNLKLYVPNKLREEVLMQYHDQNGHMGIDKTYRSIRENTIGQVFSRRWQITSVSVFLVKQGTLRRLPLKYKRLICHHIHLPKLRWIFLVHIPLRCLETNILSVSLTYTVAGPNVSPCPTRKQKLLHTC